MNRACKLNCTISPGIFSDEYVARLDSITPSGEQKNVHVFVSERCLENIKKDTALLKATVVSKSRKGIGVVLPQPTFENGPYVLVPKAIVS